MEVEGDGVEEEGRSVRSSVEKTSMADVIMSRMAATPQQRNTVVEEGGEFVKLDGDLVHYTPLSLFCLTADNKCRQKIVKLINWQWFDRFITLVILINSVLLAIRDYNDRIQGKFESEWNNNLDKIGRILSVIFFVEAVLKIAAMGFCMHKTAYLQDGWNILDFFVVVCSILDFFPELEVSALQILRNFRMLRPLRSINKIKRMKMLINSLMSSLFGLLNVVAFLAFVLSIFGIFATHQFKGAQYNKCRSTLLPTPLPPLNMTVAECQVTLTKCDTNDAFGKECGVVPIDKNCSVNYHWLKAEESQSDWLCRSDEQCAAYNYEDNAGLVNKCGSPADFRLNLATDDAESEELIMYNIINFDNFLNSMRSIFVAITLEGWVLMMYNYSDASSPLLSSLFFILLVVFGSFFALNLVLAEVMCSFDEQEQERQRVEETLQTQNEDTQGNDEGFEEPAVNVSLKIEPSGIQVGTNTNEGILPKIESNMSTRHNAAKGFIRMEKVIDEGGLVSDSMQSRNVSSSLHNSVPLHPVLLMKQTMSVDRESEVIPNEVEEKEDASQWRQEPESEILARSRASQNRYWRCIFTMVTSTHFNFLIFVLIMMNTVVLAADSFPQSIDKEGTLSAFNEFFTWVFFAEMCLKLLGLGIHSYIKDYYNLFDAFIVVVSIADWVIIKTMNPEDVSEAANLLQVFRACRLLRVFKVARSWTGMQDILQKTGKSLIDIAWFGILLSLFMFIMSLLGMELFANNCRFNQDGDLITDIPAVYNDTSVILVAPRTNFDRIDHAMTTIFIIIVGEDWPGVMYDYVRVYRNYGAAAGYKSLYSGLVSLVFMVCFTVGNMLLLSLFTAILLNNFEQGEEEEEDTGVKDEYSMMEKLKLQYVIAFGTTEAKIIIDKERSQSKLNQTVLPEVQQNQVESIQDESSDSSMVVMGAVDDLDISRSRTVILNIMKSDPLPQFKDKVEKQESEPKKLLSKQNNGGAYHKTMHVSLSLNSSNKAGSMNSLIQRIHGKSLFCLGNDKWLRRFAHKLMNHYLFDWVIMVFIILTTVCLTLDNPLLDKQDWTIVILHRIDYVMTGIFFLEMLIKIIAMGFVFNGPGSYLKDGWCILDFVIVLTSLLSFPLKEYNFTYLKSIRMLRILKPLRMIQRLRSLRLAIVSLLKSLPGIGNLLVIIAFFIFLLAILGTTLFKGKLYRCETSQLSALSYEDKRDRITTKADCLNYGGDWVNPDLNFDSTPAAFITLFTVMSTEGWIGVMWDCVDAVGIDMQPVQNYNRLQIVFFVFLVIILCMLFMNLWVGVVCETFNKESYKLSLNHLLHKDTATWIKIQLKCYSVKPEKKFGADPSFNRIRNCCINLANHPLFESIIMLCIVLNTLCLAVVWYQMDPSVVWAMEMLNFLFMFIFTVEAVIKLIALRSYYFANSWNIFDFIVVIGSITAVLLEVFKINEDIATQATIVRILRVLRVLRIIKRAKKLQMIFDTIVIAAPAMGSLGLLLLLIVVLFAIIGMQLFAFVKLQSELNARANFQSFTNSFLLLMRCATGEGWNALMFDTARTRSIDFQCVDGGHYDEHNQTNGCGMPYVARFYFMGFQVMVGQVFLNLFIAIVIDTFLEQKQVYDLPVGQLDIDLFVETWQQYDNEGTGYMDWKKFDQFLGDLMRRDTDFFADYLLEEVKSDQDVQRLISHLDIPMHKGLTSVNFYDVLLAICHYRCETTNEDYKERYDTIRHTLMQKSSFSGPYAQNKLNRTLNAKLAQDKRCKQILSRMCHLCEIDERVELKINVVKLATKQVKQFEKGVDKRCDHNGEIYTSKHGIAVRNVEKQMRVVLDARKARAAQVTRLGSNQVDTIKQVIKSNNEGSLPRL